ncbi:MAG: chemotaxis protein CheW [Isosphaeraceae bacterium]
MNSHEPFETAGRPTRPWCLFKSGAGAYAIGLEAVAEVVEVDRLVRLPHCPPRVVGMCSLRREVLPVVALSRAEGEEAKGPHLMLILRSGQGPWALEISQEGTSVVEEPLEGLAPGQHGGAPGVAFLGSLNRGDVTHAVIDPAATWQGLRSEVEAWYTDHWVRGKAARSPARS